MKNLIPGGWAGRTGILVIVGAVLVLWLLSGFYRVLPGENGVVTIFGRWDGTVKEEGLRWAPPAPIGQSQTPRVAEVRRLEVGFSSGASTRAAAETRNEPKESLMLTGDENIIDIDFEVFWRISDAGKFLFKIQNQEETVKAVAESAMREVIGRRPLESALTTGRLEVEQETRDLMQGVLDSYESGVLVTEIKLRKADTPPEVIDDFRDVQAAGADREAKINVAQRYRAELLPVARGEAAQVVQQAEAYKAEVVARAQGEAARFSSVYNEYRQSQDVTKRRMYLETMEEILRNVDKVIIDNKSGGVVPYLPLPEVRKHQQQGATP